MRKANNEAAAREAASDTFTKEQIEEFPEIEYERTVARVAGAKVPMRRLVLTGAWEVDDSPGSAPAATAH